MRSITSTSRPTGRAMRLPTHHPRGPSTETANTIPISAVRASDAQSGAKAADSTSVNTKPRV
ncbi:hypothetical protein D9M69_679470 [compost metagenome]